MGMYTQVRGFLCCGSIGSGPDFADNQKRFEALQLEFSEKNPEDMARPWVPQDSHIHEGSNGSQWIFIGSEHKNYDASMDKWIAVLVREFRCEGRIEFHYEEEAPGENIRVLKITPGMIQESREVTHCEGYGFGI